MSDQVTIHPRSASLSRAGRIFAVAAVPWFFMSLIALDALGVIGRGSSPLARQASILIALVPVAILVLHGFLGRLPGFGWFYHRIQPVLVVGPEALVVQLRGVAARSIPWENIEGLRVRPNRAADILGEGGVALVRIPEELILAGGTRWQSESVASVVVRVRPDRYRLSGANWAGVPTEFALRRHGNSPDNGDRWAARRKHVNVGVVIAAVAVIAVVVIRLVMS
jgi:hypothetical protein